MSHSSAQTHIYIVGAQCTGKTTLVNALEAYFRQTLSPHEQPAIVREVARTVLVEHGFAAADITSSPTKALALQKLILEGQVRVEENALTRSSWILSDRSGVDPISYALRHVSRDAADALIQGPEWQVLKERMAKSLIIVCESGASWLNDDGVRLMPRDMQDWTEFHALFCGLLDNLGLKYEVLPSSMTEVSQRVHFVVSKWADIREKVHEVAQNIWQ
ncbi:AAA domain-containing protein [Podospora didyma]|uniref:AAA domain-containing protein n=1 Tax=Podospora didyma TaxID=330526 RepID=A0AAE0NSK5_9PEZI|nr:AAA domain-containing protein [Podospora didyma]